MALTDDIRERLASLEDIVCELTADELPRALRDLDDERVVQVLAHTTAVISLTESIRIAAAGVVAERSSRERGHGGLAQTRGHRSPISLVQEITGSTRPDAVKQVRLGSTLLETADASSVEVDPPEVGQDSLSTAPETVPLLPWHAPLDRALWKGAVSSSQHDAILRGLGEPTADDASAAAAWSLAAEQLVAESAERTVEELRKAARSIRDLLDPAGAERRFDERFERRSFRMWTDDDGVARASMSLDDEAAAWLRTAIDAALRPRRGGPRFVDSAEKERAARLVDDPRTNDQLAYDLVLDILRAGTLAEAEAVFGARRAGVRLVTVVERSDGGIAPRSAHLEEDGAALPLWLATQAMCETGTIDCTVDRDGNPLYLGREARLFSAKQRVTLALRDGGCRWRGCDRPPSYCEAHHIDHFAEDEGRTDVDRGILLCRFHHMHLHHGGWKILRDGLGDFVLRAPDGSMSALRPRIALTYAWAGVDPPPRRLLRAA